MVLMRFRLAKLSEVALKMRKSAKDGLIFFFLAADIPEIYAIMQLQIVPF